MVKKRIMSLQSICKWHRVLNMVTNSFKLKVSKSLWMICTWSWLSVSTLACNLKMAKPFKKTDQLCWDTLIQMLPAKQLSNREKSMQKKSTKSAHGSISLLDLLTHILDSASDTINSNQTLKPCMKWATLSSGISSVQLSFSMFPDRSPNIWVKWTQEFISSLFLAEILVHILQPIRLRARFFSLLARNSWFAKNKWQTTEF